MRFSMLKYDGKASSVTMFPIMTTQYSSGSDRQSLCSALTESKKSGDAESGKMSVGCHADDPGISSGSMFCSAQPSMLCKLGAYWAFGKLIFARCSCHQHTCKRGVFVCKLSENIGEDVCA